MMYCHGRDKYFRPCIVLDSSVFESIRSKRPDLFEMDVICTAGVFLLSYVRKHMFLPGQVENWVIINNLNKLALNKVPRKEMQKLIWVLQNNFRCTMGRAWGINCTKFQLVCFKIIEIFIEE